MSGPVDPGANRARQPFDSGQETEREPLSSGEAIMDNQSCGVCRTCRPAGAADQLRARVSSRLGGRVPDIRLLVQEGGIILQGRSRTYYAKPLAQQAVMEETDLPVLANEIEVR